MRLLSLSLAAALLVSGCSPTAAPTVAPAGGWGSGATAASTTARDARLTRWEREWEEAKQTVATSRDRAVAAGEPIRPELDRQVTELLDRRIGDDQGDETRIEDLQDAVSDALRLAELVSSR